MKKVLITLSVAIGSLGMHPLIASEPAGAGANAPRQVLIEAAIVEVMLSDSGGSAPGESKAHPRPETGYSSGAEAVRKAGISLETKFVGDLTAGAESGKPYNLSYADRLGGDLDSMVTALSRDSRVKILQRPRIQTSHGVPASLFVGQTCPRPSRAHDAVSAAPSVEQIQIGTELDIAPLISPDGTVAMDLHVKVDHLEGSKMIPNVGEVPVVSSREVQVRLSVRDHDTILLGGLIGTNRTQPVAYIPFPKELPVPRALSAGSGARLERSELLVLVRPTLLAGQGAAASQGSSADSVAR